MPNLGGVSEGRVQKRPKSMESCKENVENLTLDGKSKSRTPPVRDGTSRTREQFESRPNNLDFYDWQPGHSMTDNAWQMKKRNEERQRGKWSYQPQNYGSSEEGAELGSRKVVNRQLSPGQRAAVAIPSPTGQLSSYQQHQQLTLSEADESLGNSRENLEKERQCAREKEKEKQSEDEVDLPDMDQLFGQLLRIQNSIKQASVMLDKIMLLPEPQRSEQKGHLLSILRQLKEEEHGYKVLLRGILTSREVDEDSARICASGNSRSSNPDIGHTSLKEGEEDQDEDESIPKPNNRENYRPHFSIVTSDRQHEMSQLVTADDQSSTVAGSEASAVSVQRRQLQKTLQNLEQKKQQMDDLLVKLQQLRSDHLFLDSDDATVCSIMNSVRASSSADRTADDAEQMLAKMETRHKLKKLKEMRGRLDQLRTLMQFYQNGDVDSVPADGISGDNSSHEDNAVDDEDEHDEDSKFSRSSVLPKRTRPDRRSSGDNREEPLRLNSSTHSQDGERQKRTDSVSCESLLQRRDGAGAVAEKMRELEAASNKLQRLQQLVAMVQQSGISEDVAVAVSDLEDGVEKSEANQHLASDVEDENQRGDEEFYSQKMREQQKELHALMKERQRLLKLRVDLDKIQENIPDDLVGDEDQRTAELSSRVRHPLDGKWVTRVQGTTPKRAAAPPASQETAQVTFQDPLESVVSNEEVYDQMRWQRMLREEQREKKRGRVNDEVAPKRSSANQDGRSEGTSTYRSDQYRTSPSEDVTMATWGGSTAGNLESIEENENRSNNETGDDDDDGGGDGDNEKDEDEDESDNLLQVEEEEEEDALNNEDDDDDEENFDEDAPDVAPTRRWRRNRANEDSVRMDIRYNNRSSLVKQRQKEKNQGLCIVQQSILSLKKQVAQLAGAVKKAVKHKRHENKANSSEQAVQLQQNQLFLGLNQSYFQLIATQNNLMERFNHLEQLVLNSRNEIVLADGFYPNVRDPDKPTPSPFPVTAQAWHHDANLSSSASVVLEPGRTNLQQNLGFEVNFIDGQSSSVKRVSPVAPKRPTTGDIYSGAFSPYTGELNCSMGRQVAGRTNGRYLGTSELEEPGVARDPLVLTTPKTPRFENAEEVVIRQQNSGSARACAMAHLASQKVVDAKGDQRFLRTIADDASVSSIPGSCSEAPSKPDGRMIVGNGGSSFERLSDEIYSGVASLISQNEHCPDFLIQLFRKLQCLSTDFLRQRALDALRDLVRHVPAEAEMRFASGSSHLNMGAGQPGMIPLLKSPCLEDGAGMSSGQSTPSPCSQWENPFESDPLGDTVIHFDRMLQVVRESEQNVAEPHHASDGHTPNARDAAGAAAALGGSMRWSNSSDNHPSKTDSSRAPLLNEKGSDGSVSDDTCPRIDAHELDQQIKEIMMEVIPVVKEHISGICSQPLLQYVEDMVMSLVCHLDRTQQQFERFFRQQLTTILKDSLAKFEGRKMLECGEDLLVDLSEILFNELAFFRLMQNLDRSKAQVKAKLLTWQRDSPTSTSSGHIQKQQKVTKFSSSSSSDSGELTESDLESVDAEKEMNNAGESVNAVGADGKKERERQKEKENYFSLDDKEKIKEAANCDSELSAVDEFMEEDKYYTENMKFFLDNESVDDSLSMDESFCNSNVKIELAPSETKPFTRIGSDEDDEAADEAASADDPYETAVSRDAEKERCSKTSTSSATGSITSMEHESSCKGTMEKEEEEKEKDTQEMEPVTLEADAVNSGLLVREEHGSVHAVETVDGERVLNKSSDDASDNQNVTGASIVELGTVSMA